MASAVSTSSSSSQAPTSTASDQTKDLIREMRSHEVAIAELGGLPSSRHVYQKNGSIFFRTTIQQATSSEQRQLDLARSKMQKLNSP